MQTYQSAVIDYNHADTIAANPAVRPSCMIINPDSCDGGLIGELARLRAQGYVIHAVEVQTYCATCTGSGKVRKYKKQLYSWKACPDCKGHDGALASIAVPVS